MSFCSFGFIRHIGPNEDIFWNRRDPRLISCIILSVLDCRHLTRHFTCDTVTGDFVDLLESMA